MAALDPVAATYQGLTGHEGRLTDLSPDGFAERDRLVRTALAEAGSLTPVDEREQVALEAFTERLGLQVEQYDAGVPQSQVSVIASGLHEVRGVFDLMDAEDEEGATLVDARLAAVPATLDGYRSTLAARSGRGTGLGPPPARGRRPSGPGLDRAGRVLRHPRARPAARSPPRCRTGCASTPGAPPRRSPTFGRWLTADLLPRGREQDAVGRDLYALGSRSSLGAGVDLEEAYAWGWEELRRIEDEMAGSPTASCPAAPWTRPWSTSTPTRPARCTAPRPSGTGCRSSPTARWHELADVHFDIPAAGTTHRVPDRAHPRRRHLLHRPERGLHPSRPHVVVGARGHRHLRDLARGHHGLPRGRARPPPAGRPDGVPGRPAQPLAADGVLGLRPRRGLGAVRRAADGRARPPRGPRRPARACSTARASGPRGWSSTSACTCSWRSRATTRSASTPARRGRRSWAWSSCASTAATPSPPSASSWTATSAGRGRRRRTSSASGSGCRPAPTRRPAPGAAFDLRAFHRSALDLGSLGLDPFRAALARLT